MRPAPFLPEEDGRLAALSEYGVSSGGMEIELDRVIALTANLFDVPIVLVSLVERERQIFPAKMGVDICETDRNISFCAHALQQHDVFVVLDATLDPRFYDNPLVTGEPRIRFYAGAPLIAPSGFGLGTLCLIDTKPRNRFSESDQRNLRDLASLVLDKMELHRLDIAQRSSQLRFEQIAATSPDGIICTDEKGMVSFWNRAATNLFGYTEEEMSKQPIERVLPYHIGHRRAEDVMREEAEDNPKQWIGKTIEIKARRKDGSEFLTELSLSTWDDGEVVNYAAIVRDITERRSNEDRLFRLAHLDSLTNLPNRMVLRNRIAQGETSSQPMSVIVLGV
jgi:PAS domain S-box-containing protein